MKLTNPSAPRDTLARSLMNQGTGPSGGGFPGDAYLTPDGSDYYRTPDGSSYYATP